MGIYRRVEVCMWSDKKFRRLSPLPPSGQSLWMYLLTGPQTCQIPGLFRSGHAAIAEELCWELPDFEKAFKEILSEGMVKDSPKDRLIWLPNAVRHNPPASPNVIRSWASALDILPECDLLTVAIEAMREDVYSLDKSGEGFREAFDEVFGEALPKASPEGLPEALLKAMPEAFGEGNAKPLANQEQEQKQNQKEEGSVRVGAREPPLFLENSHLQETNPIRILERETGKIKPGFRVPSSMIPNLIGYWKSLGEDLFTRTLAEYLEKKGSSIKYFAEDFPKYLISAYKKKDEGVPDPRSGLSEEFKYTLIHGVPPLPKETVEKFDRFKKRIGAAG
jgi:hypothetical protein